MRRLLEWSAGARWALTAAFFVGVNWLLLAPSKSFREVHVFLAHQDKLAHAGIFLGLALLVRWSLGAGRGGAVVGAIAVGRGAGRVPWASWVVWAAFAALLCYAASIECFQPLLKRNGRSFEWLDMASNFAGVVAGWLVYRVAGGNRYTSGKSALEAA